MYHDIKPMAQNIKDIKNYVKRVVQMEFVSGIITGI